MDSDRKRKVAVLGGAAAVLGAAEMVKRKQRRQCWVHPILATRKTDSQYFRLVQDIRIGRPDDYFKYHRMTPAVFDVLLAKIENRLQRSSIREPISPSELLSMTLKHLAHGDDIATIAWDYRVGTSTARNGIFDTCQAIWEELRPIYLPAVTKEIWLKNAEEFDRLWQFPNAIGSIDGKHIVIQQPVGGGSDLYNYKGTHSIVLLAVTNARKRFTAVDIGRNGRISDGGVFRRSVLGQRFFDGTLNIPEKRPLPDAVDTTSMPFVLVGDNAFPLGENLMKPYAGQQLSGEQSVFNYRLSRCRQTVEDSFGILATRWRILRGPIIVRKVETAKVKVEAMVCLHNFLMSDDIREINRFSTSNIYYYDDTTLDSSYLKPICRQGSNNFTHDAGEYRNKFAQYFFSEGSVSWQDKMINSGKDALQS